MTSYSLDRIPRITGGPGALARIGDLAQALGASSSAVLIVADPGLRAAGHIDAAIGALRERGLTSILYDEVRGDPTSAQVDQVAALARAERIATVVALGGGSAMDLGKAVAAVAAASAPTAHYELCANPLPARPLSKIVVPTTSGTGSETTRTSVMINAAGSKVWLWGDELKADEVVLDPELTVGLPAHLTAATGIDALVHAIEASTNNNANDANDLYCHAAIRLVTRYLKTAVANPADLEARGALQRAAAYAGIGIDNAGTALAHNIGHALASLRPIHHGRAVGLAMMATLRWNVEVGGDRYAAVAAAMGERAEASALPVAYERLVRSVDIKVSLMGEGHDDVTAEAVARYMAANENAPMRKSNRRVVRDDDLVPLARAVLEQA